MKEFCSLNQRVLSLLLCFCGTICFGALSGPGDLAFVGHDTDPDNIAFVPLVDIAINQSVFFTDKEWNGMAIGGGGAFNSGEGDVEWTNNTGG